MLGNLIDEHDVDAGDFISKKISKTGAFEYCFHQGIAAIKADEETTININVFNLKIPSTGDAYCCDKISFSACTLAETSCRLGVMASDYSMFLLTGETNDGICTGKATSIFPAAPVLNFTFTDESECRKTRYD